MSLLAYFRRLVQLRNLHKQAMARNPEKALRARYLGQMDRQLTPIEWEEFKRLILEGY